MTRRKKQGGNALIEFALSASLLVSLFTGVFQFGYTMIAVENLSTAVRGGARFAAATDYSAGDYQTRVKNMVVYGQPTTGTESVVAGLTTANVEVVLTPNAGVPETVTVRIINFSVDALFRTFNFNGTPNATFPYNGS
jgi:Flp pilus assembly protein TadG